MMKLFPLGLLGGAFGSGMYAACQGDQVGVRVSMLVAVIAVSWAWLVNRRSKRPD